MDFVSEAARRRHQAEELRAKSELMADEATRARYLRMAEAYDAMADQEERITRMPKSDV